VFLNRYLKSAPEGAIVNTLVALTNDMVELVLSTFPVTGSIGNPVGS
jgi:hypothetical protein